MPTRRRRQLHASIVLNTNPSSFISPLPIPILDARAFILPRRHARANELHLAPPLAMLTLTPWCSSAQQVAPQLRLLQDAPATAKKRNLPTHDHYTIEHRSRCRFSQRGAGDPKSRQFRPQYAIEPIATYSIEEIEVSVLTKGGATQNPDNFAHYIYAIE
jgi:hypothetical protein